MTDAPEVSVVIPVWNRYDAVRRALRSVLAQDHPSFEVIVADDGSTDGSAAAARASADERVRVVELPHRGVSAARNSGARAACGGVLAFLDSDDEALPGWLTALAEALRAPGRGLASCGCLRRTPGAGPATDVVRLPEDLGPIFGNRRGMFLAGTFAVRRDLFDATGGYAEALAFAENTELAIRLIELCAERDLEVSAIERPLLVYHVAPRRPPTSPATARVRLEATRYLLERHADRFAADRRVRALHRSVAGVCAARLGRWPEARGWFRRALYDDPGNLRHAARWLAAWVPVVARRRWRLGEARR